MTTEDNQAMKDRSRRFNALMDARQKQYPHESYHDRFMRCSASPEGSAIWAEAERAKHPAKTQNTMMAANSYNPDQPRDENGRWTDDGTYIVKGYRGDVGEAKSADKETGGIHFSESEAIASQYAEDSERIQSGVLREAELTIKKPLDFRALVKNDASKAEVTKFITDHGIDLDTPLPAHALNSNVPKLKTVRDWINMTGEDEFGKNFAPSTVTDVLGDAAKKVGIGGFIFPEGGKGGEVSYVVFHDHQIREISRRTL